MENSKPFLIVTIDTECDKSSNWRTKSPLTFRSVTEGTATMLRGLPVPAGGKTGTAEDFGSPNHEADAWFTAAAPINQPEVVATVMVRGAGEGYFTAEPTVASILSYYYAHHAAITREELVLQPLATVVKPGSWSPRARNLSFLRSRTP